MLEPQESSARNIFPGKIIGMELKNHLVRLNVDAGEIALFVDVTEYAREQLNLTRKRNLYRF